jgi:hypothetical protein
MTGVEEVAVFAVAMVVTLGTFHVLSLLLRWLVNMLNPGHLRITDSDRGLLERFLPYYVLLSAKDRRAFERRVGDWVSDKEWHGRGVEVTREMRVLIAGSAAQVTSAWTLCCSCISRASSCTPTNTGTARRTGITSAK